MKNLKLDNQGFSLLEIMVVVGIMGILTLIGIPAYQGYRASATRSVAVTNSRNIASAYKVCRATGGACNSYAAIQMEDLNGRVDGTPRIGTDATCFGLEQVTGNEVVKSCVSIDNDSGKASYTIGWYAVGVALATNNNPDKMCFCADTGTQANPILIGSEVTCDTDNDCSSVGQACGTGQGKSCLAQQGICQTSGLCL